MKFQLIILFLSLISIKSEIASDTTYFIYSGLNDGLALMPKDSRPGWENCVLFDVSKSDSQKWRFIGSGSSWNIKNSGTELFLHYREEVKNAQVDQNFRDDSDYYKWNIIEVGDGAYMLEAAKKDEEGNKYYATAEEGKRGSAIYLRSLNSDNKGQIWHFEKTDNVDSNEFTKEKANEIGKAYLNKYYVDTKQSNGSTRKSLGGGFWPQAEMCEMLLDAYQTLGDNTYRQAFENTYLDELDNVGNRYPYWQGMTETDWKDNPFNDDIMWLVLASVRAYFYFGNGGDRFTDYLSNAKNNFQTVVDRGTKSDGTMRWSHEDGRGDGTTSCINGPTTIAACYLGEALGEDSYFTKARTVHAAQRKTMFEPDTGKVLDSPTNNWPSCYNQGTWIGACVLLYKHFGDEQYFQDAVIAMEYLIKNDGHFSDKYGILQVETQTEGDLTVFRSILMRYVRMFIVEFADKIDVTPYLKWFQKNAKVVYNNKNIYGLVQTPFNFATDKGMDFAQAGMSGGVSLVLNMVYGDKVERDAFSRIEAEDFNYIRGAIVENTPDTDGGKQVAGVMDGYYTGYANVKFGTNGATSAEFRMSAINDESKIEIHLDSPNGKIIGIATLPNTGKWESFDNVKCEIERTTGNHMIYLVYRKGSGNYVTNLNWFIFHE